METNKAEVGAKYTAATTLGAFLGFLINDRVLHLDGLAYAGLISAVTILLNGLMWFGIPIIRALRAKLTSLLSVMFVLGLLAAPATAQAGPDLSVQLVCTSSIVTAVELDSLAPGGSKNVYTCTGHELRMGLATGLELGALRLTGERAIIAVAAPTLGLSFSYTPPDWKLPVPSLIGWQFTLGMTTINPSAVGETVDVLLLFQLTALGLFTVGIGLDGHIAAAEGVSDSADLILTGGLRVPLE